MSNKIYAKQNGTWDDLEAIIKTAADWQASEIVLVGVTGLGAYSRELSERWDQYMIPISVVPLDGERYDPTQFDFPPFIGIATPNAFAMKMLEKDEAVVENGILRSFRPIPKSTV